MIKNITKKFFCNNSYSYKVLYENLFKILKNKNLLEEHMTIVKNDIKNKNEKIFLNDNISNIINTLNIDKLWEFSIIFYIGSVSVPKSKKISKFFLNEAKKRNLTKDEKLNLEFYEVIFLKLSSMETGNQNEFYKLNEKLYDLMKLNNPLAMFNCAKEIYFNAINLNSKNNSKKKEMFTICYDIFLKCSELGFYESFFYLGNIYENGYSNKGINLELALEFYNLSAANNNSQAYFKLSQFYNKGIGTKQDLNLYYKYLKISAELGLPESMHNLGLYYLEKKEMIKAYIWFTHAGKNDFSPSLYNALKISIENLKDKTRSDELINIIKKKKINIEDLLLTYNKQFK